jgi:hypothetical protein
MSNIAQRGNLEYRIITFQIGDLKAPAIIIVGVFMEHPDTAMPRARPWVGGQRYTTTGMRVELSQNLDGNFSILRVQQRVDRRQVVIEAYIDDATPHRDHCAKVRRTASSGCPGYCAPCAFLRMGTTVREFFSRSLRSVFSFQVIHYLEINFYAMLPTRSATAYIILICIE